MKNKKKIIIIIIIMFALALLLLGYLSRNTKINVKPKKTDSLLTNKKYEGLSITDINMYTNDDLNHVTMYVKNTSDSKFSSRLVKFVFYDDTNKVIYSKTSIIPDIESGKVVSLDLIVSDEALNAKNFKIVSN